MTRHIARLRQVNLGAIFNANGTSVPGCNPATDLSTVNRGSLKIPEVQIT